MAGGDLDITDVAYERRSRGEPDRAAAAVALLGVARVTAAELSSTADRTVLLHGDFIGKNLLRTAHGYVAVDPLPRLGDPGADIGSFAADRPPAVSILDNAADIAGRMGLDPWRARRWAAVLAVLQTAQAWRQDQAALDTQMGSGELRAAFTLPSSSGKRSTPPESAAPSRRHSAVDLGGLLVIESRPRWRGSSK